MAIERELKIWYLCRKKNRRKNLAAQEHRKGPTRNSGRIRHQAQQDANPDRIDKRRALSPLRNACFPITLIQQFLFFSAIETYWVLRLFVSPCDPNDFFLSVWLLSIILTKITTTFELAIFFLSQKKPQYPAGEVLKLWGRSHMKWVPSYQRKYAY